MEKKSAQEITEYLKMAMALESSVYNQKAAKKTAEDELQQLYPQKVLPDAPYKKQAYEPKYTPPKVEDNSGCVGGLLFVFLGCVVFALLLFQDGLGALGFLSLMIGLFFIGRIIAVNRLDNESEKKKDEYDKAFNASREKYKQQCIENEKDYQEQLVVFQEEIANAEKEYEHRMELYHQAEEAVAQLDQPLNETEAVLEELYKNNMIYPKYHNLVAICSFYEYFLSGRCTELAGPNGAYNLYESELRQNIIINKLDNITNQLEQIKANQYALYMELNAARKVTEGISADINGILSETISISEASNISAACAEATAKNTEALKYISLINGAQN